MTFRPFAAVVLVACAIGGGVTSAQQATAPQASPEPPPTFRVEVNYVEVDAAVTDAQGNAVTSLTADDFEVIEDGKPQKVTAFSRLDLPIVHADQPMFAAGPIEPDVQSNAAADGRLYLIVLDDLHTTFSNTGRVRAALKQFMERYFGTNDLAAVVFTGGRSQDAQDFTGNRRLLMAAIDKFSGRNLPSATGERFAGFGTSCGAATPDFVPGAADPCETERAFNAQNALASMRRVADFMAGVRGRRKAMLLVSEGISYDINDIFGNRSASAIISDTRDVIAAATRGNVAIYAIDPRGLAGLDDITIDGIPDERCNESPARGLQSELVLSQNSLRTLSEETGGFAAVNRNDLDAAFARIVRENSSYYVLGYYPTNSRRDGRYRKIEVRVKRPGLQVRSRKGYVAPRGRAPEVRAASENPALRAATEAMGSPIPVGGLPISVFAAPFKGTAPNASIALAIEMRVDGFRFTDANGTFNDRAEMTISATDTAGKVRASSANAFTLTLKPETLARAKERGLRVVSQLELPAGRYQLRIAVGEDGGRAGSALYDLEVPDFSKAPLSMSGVALTSILSSQTPTVLPKNPLGTFLPGPPVTVREFSREDELVLFAEFYENVPNAPPHQLDITTSLRADGGRVVLSNTDQRSSTELQGSQGGYGVTASLPLKGVEPGLYVLHVEGRTRVGTSEATTARDIQIRVR